MTTRFEDDALNLISTVSNVEARLAGLEAKVELHVGKNEVYQKEVMLQLQAIHEEIAKRKAITRWSFGVITFIGTAIAGLFSINLFD